jgi:uncharacterized membrane protein
MTYEKWEKRLKRCLKHLPAEEKEDAVRYYKEMYDDKLEAGCSPEDILGEFGIPKACAQRILSDNGLPLPKKTGRSIGWWVGMSFLTLLLILPIGAALFSVILSFGAVAFSGGASALAGALYALASPFLAIDGINFWGVITHMGMGFAVCGMGLLLMVVFAYATKYLYKWTIKVLILVYKRR